MNSIPPRVLGREIGATRGFLRKMAPKKSSQEDPHSRPRPLDERTILPGGPSMKAAPYAIQPLGSRFVT